MSDLASVVADLDPFWDGRDTAFLHQALYLHEFGDTALVVREPADERRVLAYLLGFVNPHGVAYVHAVAVRRGHRGEGHASNLYKEFERRARALGASVLKAITHPSNGGSIAFHRALGFTVEEVPNYSFNGESRMVFRREMSN
jgi:ribosomal protein S18 acetylase RimI-like enzyme